jgi:DNA replicative helicase MCM subunit Mcm2 (Cdc46/Mcm family)
MKKKVYNESLDIKNRFISFIENFSLHNGFRPYCLHQILKNFVKKNIILSINLSHIADFDPQLYIKITEFSGELVCFFDYVLNEFYFSDIFFKKNKAENKLKICFWYPKSQYHFDVYEISSKLFNKIISIHGKIIKTTNNFSELSSILFKCEICGFETYSLGDLGTIQEPVYCFLCKNFNSFIIWFDRCYYNKIKFLKIQNQQFINRNQNRTDSLLLIYRNHRSKSFIAGDTIRATGILRVNPFFDKIKKLNSIFFGVYLDSMYIIKINKNRQTYDNNRKEFFFEDKQINFFNLKNQRILYSSLAQNLNFYKIFQDSCFKEKVGIETIKKTFAMMYCHKFEDNMNISLIINSQNIEEEILNLENIYKGLDKCIYINGKIDEEECITFSFDRTDDWTDYKLIKGKLLNSNRRICFLKNLNFSNNNVIQIFKEILTFHKASLSRSGLNCCLEVQNSIIVLFNKSNTQIFSRSAQKTFEKNFVSLINLFDLAYLLKKPKLYISQDYTLKLLKYNFYTKTLEIDSKKLKLKRIGFKFEGVKFFFGFKRKRSKYLVPTFSLMEIIKMNNLVKILTKIKLKKKWKFLKNFSIIIKTIASNLTFFRLSNILAIEDIRLAFIIISESLKSEDFF